MSSKILDCPECHHRFNFEYENELPDSISCPGCGKTSPKDEYSALVICHSCRTKLRIPLDILYDPDNSCPKCGVKLDPQTLFSETNVESTFTGHAADQHKLYKRLLQDGELFDKFRIVRLLGKGGMAEVYLAEHLLLNKLCALKLMRSNVASDDAVFVKRFLREAKLTNSITHPNIVKVFDVGNDFKSGTLFIAMEYVEGKTLLQLMKEKTLSEEELKSILVSMTNALQALYDAQIVHRDIKPSNIMLDNDGVLKLMDLGIAKFSGNKQEGEMTLTMEQASIGTPSYASPEQCRSAHSADIRSDIYCLGATLYHLASGKLPFEGSTPVETILQVLDKEPEPLKDLRPDLSKKMLNLIGRMMMKNPDERPANPDALLAMVYGCKDDFNGNWLQKLLRKMGQPLKNFIIPPKEERTVAKLFARTVKLFVAVVSIFVALYALNHIYEQREAMDAKKRAVEEAKKPKPFDPTQNKQSMVTYPTVTVGSRYGQQQARFPLVKVKRPSGTVLEYDKPEQFISPEDNTTVVWQIKDGILEYNSDAGGKGNVHMILSKHLKAPDMRLYSHWAVSVDFQINSINDGLLFNLSDFGVYAFNKRLLITEGRNYVRTSLTLEPDKWMNLTLSLDRKMRKFTILSGDRLLGCYVFPQHSFGIGEMKLRWSKENLRIKIDRIRFYKSPIDFTVPDKVVHEPVLFSSERLSAAATDAAAAPAAKTDPAQYDGVWMTDYQAAREKAKRENKRLLIMVNSKEDSKTYFYDKIQRYFKETSVGAERVRKEFADYVPVRVFFNKDEIGQLNLKEKFDLPGENKNFQAEKYMLPKNSNIARLFQFTPALIAVTPDWKQCAITNWPVTRADGIFARLAVIRQQLGDTDANITDPLYDEMWLTDFNEAKQRAKAANKGILLYVGEKNNVQLWNRLNTYIGSAAGSAEKCRQAIEKYIPVRVFLQQDEIAQLDLKEKFDLPGSYETDFAEKTMRSSDNRYDSLLIAIAPDDSKSAFVKLNSTERFPVSLEEKLAKLHQQTGKSVPAAKTAPVQYDGVWITDYQAAREKARADNKWLLIFVSVEEEKQYFFNPMQRHLNSNSAGAVLCRKELSRYVPVRVFVSRDELPQLTWKEKLDLPEVPQKYRSPEEAMRSRVTGRDFEYVPMMFAVSPDWTRTAAIHWNSTRPYAISERLSLINQQVIDSGDTSNTYGDYVKRQSTYSSDSGNAPADGINILVYKQVFSPQNNYKNKPVWVFAGKDQQEIDALQNAARDALAGSGEKPLVMHIDCSNMQDEFLQLARKRIFGDNNTLPAVALLGINREVSFLEYGITPEKITDFCKTSLSEYQKEAEVVFAPGVRTAKRRLQECRLRLTRLQKLPVTELRKAQIDYVQKQIIELNKLINMEIARKNARYSATATRNFQKKLQSYCLTGQGTSYHDSRRDHLVQQRKEILQLLRNPAVDPNCTVSVKNYKGEMQQLSLLAIALGNGFMESREEFKKILLSRNPDPDSAKRPNSIERYCLGQDIASESSAGRVFARKLLNADNKLIVGNYYDSSDFKKYMLLNPGIHYYGSGNQMMIAAEIDSADVANELILSGYNYGYETVMGATPWRNALKHGSKSVVNLLKKYYFNTEENSQVRRQYEFCEAMRRKDYAAVEEYISQGADINQVWENGLNALQNACIINDVKLVKLLRKNGADPAAFEELRRFRVISNPLQIAVSKNNPELFAELCNSNIDKKAMVPGFNNISNMPLSAFIIQMAKYTKDDSTAIAMLKTIDRYGGDGSTPRRLLTRLSNTFRPQENSRVQYNILNYLLHNRKVSQADIGYVINGVWNRDCRNLLARSRRTDR